MREELGHLVHEREAVAHEQHAKAGAVAPRSGDVACLDRRGLGADDADVLETLEEPPRQREGDGHAERQAKELAHAPGIGTLPSENEQPIAAERTGGEIVVEACE